MSKFDRAILIDGQLRWLDDALEAFRRETDELRGRVTIEEIGGQNESGLGTLFDKRGRSV